MLVDSNRFDWTLSPHVLADVTEIVYQVHQRLLGRIKGLYEFRERKVCEYFSWIAALGTSVH